MQAGRAALLLGRFHMHGVPRKVELGRQAGAAAHHLFGVVARANAGQEGLAVGPHGLWRCGAGAAVGAHFVVHPVCRAAQGQLAQGQQIAFAKEVGGGALGLLGQVDLAGLQARQQLVGRQVDHHHLIGCVKKLVGHRLPHADAGDAAHDVVQALQVLHVHGGPHVDACGQQFFGVLPALGVARPGHIAVGQLVQQHQALGVLRAPGQCGVQVKFGQGAVFVGQGAQWQARQVRGQRLGVGPAVRLDHADGDGQALRLCGPCRRQHGEGLAHARAGAEEHLEPPALLLGLLLLDALQQRVGVGAILHGHSVLVDFESNWPLALVRQAQAAIVLVAIRVPSSKPARSHAARPAHPARGFRCAAAPGPAPAPAAGHVPLPRGLPGSRQRRG